MNRTRRKKLRRVYNLANRQRPNLLASPEEFTYALVAFLCLVASTQGKLAVLHYFCRSAEKQC